MPLGLGMSGLAENPSTKSLTPCFTFDGFGKQGFTLLSLPSFFAKTRKIDPGKFFGDKGTYEREKRLARRRIGETQPLYRLPRFCGGGGFSLRRSQDPHHNQPRRWRPWIVATGDRNCSRRGHDFLRCAGNDRPHKRRTAGYEESKNRRP